MVYREIEKPRWRSVVITHKVAGVLLRSGGTEPDWLNIGGYIILRPSEMVLAVTIFLNRLSDAGVRPEHVQVTFQPQSGESGSSDERSRYTIFYFGLHDMDPCA